MQQVFIKSYNLTVTAGSMQGGRPENQDDIGFIETPLGFLLVVCDGMGGGPGGKTASYVAKCVFMQTVMEASPQASRADILRRAVALANEAIYQKMDETPSLRGMGSTLVALLVSRHSAFIAHLGDSRCYRVSGKRALYRTTDHSLVAELVKNKALTEEQARLSPQSNVITRGLGNTSNHVPEIEEVPYRKGDRFILCTDGVWGIMPHKDLLRFLTSTDSDAIMVKKLSDQIERLGQQGGGHHDNYTIAVVGMNTHSIIKDKMETKVKILIEALAALLLLSMVGNIVTLALKRGTTIDESSQLVVDKEEYTTLMATQQRYVEIVDNGTESFRNAIRKIEQMERTNDSLLLCITKLEHALAEQKTAAESSGKPAVRQEGTSLQGEDESAKSAPKPQADRQKKPSYRFESMTQRDLVNKMIADLEYIKTAKGKDEKKLNQEIHNRYDELMGLFQAFEEKANGQYAGKLSQIRQALEKKAESGQPILVLYQPAEKKNSGYMTTGQARSHAANIISNLNKLKDMTR